MMVARLVKVLPDVLKATQMCSVEGRSIFNGATAVLLAAEYLKQRKLPGFVALDFFHAYDRVSLRWVDCVLEAMGFGEELCSWVATCHRGAEAAFMLEELSPFMDILFSLRQGDPLAMILFMIQLEPLLARLEQVLEGLAIGPVVEKSLGYVDDVAGMGDKERDLLRLDEEVQAFEMASGAILNRNHKSVILGLGSWVGRLEWPLPWIRGVAEVKLYGITMTEDPQQTIKWTRE